MPKAKMPTKQASSMLTSTCLLMSAASAAANAAAVLLFRAASDASLGLAAANLVAFVLAAFNAATALMSSDSTPAIVV